MQRHPRRLELLCTVIVILCALRSTCAVALLRTIAPGAPEQIKLSLGGPGEMVVSWVSMDVIPTDGTCFKPNLPQLDSSSAGIAGAPFPYPMVSGIDNPACRLAESEVAIWRGLFPVPGDYKRSCPHTLEAARGSPVRRTHAIILNRTERIRRPERIHSERERVNRK